MAAAQIRMKALVASRLMMGDLPNWAAFEKERNTAAPVSRKFAASLRTLKGSVEANR